MTVTKDDCVCQLKLIRRLLEEGELTEDDLDPVEAVALAIILDIRTQRQKLREREGSA